MYSKNQRGIEGETLLKYNFPRSSLEDGDSGFLNLARADEANVGTWTIVSKRVSLSNVRFPSKNLDSSCFFPNLQWSMKPHNPHCRLTKRLYLRLSVFGVQVRLEKRPKYLLPLSRCRPFFPETVSVPAVLATIRTKFGGEKNRAPVCCIITIYQNPLSSTVFRFLSMQNHRNSLVYLSAAIVVVFPRTRPHRNERCF